MLFEGGIGVPNLFGLLAKGPNKLGTPFGVLLVDVV